MEKANLFIVVIFRTMFIAIAVNYDLLTSEKLYADQRIVAADAFIGRPVQFTCTADSPVASLEWYINGQLLSDNDVQLGVTSFGPFSDSASRTATLNMPRVAEYNEATVTCGPLSGRDPPSAAITLVWLYAPPSLLKGYPTAVQLSPNFLQFSWNGSKDDFIEYFVVTILNGTAVLMEYNTTEVQLNMTFTCGVVYRCSVVPVNMVGEGNLSSVDYKVHCSYSPGVTTTPHPGTVGTATSQPGGTSLVGLTTGSYQNGVGVLLGVYIFIGIAGGIIVIIIAVTVIVVASHPCGKRKHLHSPTCQEASSCPEGAISLTAERQTSAESTSSDSSAAIES